MYEYYSGNFWVLIQLCIKYLNKESFNPDDRFLTDRSSTDNHFYIMRTMLHLMQKQVKLFGGFDEVRIRNLLYILNVFT